MIIKKVISLLMIGFVFALTSCTTNHSSNSYSSFSDSDKYSSSLLSNEEAGIIYAYINNERLTIELVDNSSTQALVQLLAENDITYSAADYGGFEKVGNIGFTLPQNNTSITTELGDVILYQGTSLCFYYEKNTWSFTRIGKISGYTKAELMSILMVNNGDINITLSLCNEKTK